MSELLKFGRHPDADQLNAFVENALPDHERQGMFAHLAVCPDCRAIARLSLPSVVGEAAPSRVRRRWFSGWNLAWAAVPAFAALAFVLVHVYVGSRSGEPASTPIQMAEPRSPTLAAPPSAPVAEPAKKPLRAGKRSSNPKVDSVPAAKSLPRLIPSVAGTSLFTPRGDNATSSLIVDGAVATDPVAPAPLPTQLPILSMVSKDHQRLAIDSRNALFLSNDDGEHWIAVSPSWHGRVTNVALTSPSMLEQVTTGRNLAPVRNITGFPSATFKQTLGTSGLSGVVTDPAGAGIPGVTVTVTDSTGQVQSAQTDRDGHYRIDNLVDGKYQLDAQTSGFLKNSVVVDLAPSQQGLADFKLQVGATSQSVEVTAASPALSGEAESVPVHLFEITIETGEHWVSANGRNWVPK